MLFYDPITPWLQRSFIVWYRFSEIEPSQHGNNFQMQTKAMELKTWECAEFKSSLGIYLAKSEIDLCKYETIFFAVFHCGQLGWHLLEAMSRALLFLFSCLIQCIPQSLLQKGVGTYLPLVLCARAWACMYLAGLSFIAVQIAAHESHCYLVRALALQKTKKRVQRVQLA